MSQAPVFEARRHICSHSRGAHPGYARVCIWIESPWAPLSGWDRRPWLRALGGSAQSASSPWSVGVKLGSSQQSPRPGLERKGEPKGGGGMNKHPGSQCSLCVWHEGFGLGQPVPPGSGAGWGGSADQAEFRLHLAAPWDSRAPARRHPRLCPDIPFALEPEAGFTPECLVICALNIKNTSYQTMCRIPIGLFPL